jgi:hypothetical protein
MAQNRGTLVKCGSANQRDEHCELQDGHLTRPFEPPEPRAYRVDVSRAPCQKGAAMAALYFRSFCVTHGEGSWHL